MQHKMELPMKKSSSSSDHCQNDAVVQDPYRFAYIIHFFLGAGNLLPWNALITAVDYFSYLYPKKHTEKVFSVAYMTSSVLVLFVMMSWPRAWSKISLRLRMNLGFSLFVFSLMVPPVIDWASAAGCCSRGGDGGGGSRPSGAYGLTVTAVIICGIADGLVGGSLVGSAGKLPKQYMQAVFAGTASSGIIISILRIITKASLPQTPKGLQTSAHLYFIAATIFLLCCIIFCNLQFKLPVMQQYYLHHGIPDIVIVGNSLCSSAPRFWAIAAKIRCHTFGIFIIYVVTLSIFPGFIAEDLVSELFKDWYPILLISVYNIADLMGKCLTAFYIVKSIKTATWACISRFLFYPLFIVCLHGPKWLKSEGPIVVLTFVLGLTNGFLTSCLMIVAPKSVVQPSESELSAIVMIVFLGFGLVGGSVLGWVWLI
ncbi:equilibrative nucleotide transporter 8-like [Prosopis cineraria]|uniref:equilibrative nucleotide transporter 8-like n=1 Tax=Prosopis cineraria TaxID=364024 RepID=UPI0024102109|nr:equilibrative nucleotide transporter 8-like [Prosopis cineraria]